MVSVYRLSVASRGNYLSLHVATAEDRVSVKAEVHTYCMQPSRDRVGILGWSALQPPG